MKRFKHCGMLLASLLALTALLMGAAMAAESPNGARPVISVQLNGEMVPFTDVVPEVVDQRTFLPFRAVLEAMGAEVDYDAATSTVTAQRDGVSLAMTLGEKQARITENGAWRPTPKITAPMCLYASPQRPSDAVWAGTSTSRRW